MPLQLSPAEPRSGNRSGNRAGENAGNHPVSPRVRLSNAPSLSGAGCTGMVQNGSQQGWRTW